MNGPSVRIHDAIIVTVDDRNRILTMLPQTHPETHLRESFSVSVLTLLV